MCSKRDAPSLPDWLGVLAHEIVHVTGHLLNSYSGGVMRHDGVESTEFEERVAETGAEILMDRLGVTFKDTRWRVWWGTPMDDEVEEATRRVEHILSLIS